MKTKQSEPNTPKLPEDVERRFDEWRQSGQSYMNPQDFVDGWHEGRLKQFIAQELSTLKAQVRKEIEEKRREWALEVLLQAKENQHVMAHIEGTKRVETPWISIKELKSLLSLQGGSDD